jgi:hypothetical protein
MSDSFDARHGADGLDDPFDERYRLLIHGARQRRVDEDDRHVFCL